MGECANTLISSDAKVNLLGLTRARLEDFFASMGEKPFRAKQLMKWIHHYGQDDFNEMTDMSKPLRARLIAQAEIVAPKVLYDKTSSDGTRKWLVEVNGNSSVEMVYIPDKGRGTLCVSSQAGCSLDCSFCSTGKQGFQANLTVHEIVGQIWLATKALSDVPHGKERKVTNIVMMGMGEPLLNFDNAIDAVNIAMDDFGYGLSKRRVTVSTSGVVPKIRAMIGKTEASLALSLHAPEDLLRNELVPINKKYGIEETLQACRDYIASTEDTHRVMTIEYTLIDQVNDRLSDAQALAHLLKDTPCKINLIPFNPFPNSGYQKPSNNRIMRFRDTLSELNHIVTIRTTRGDDIDAACGQLVGQITDKTKRSAKYLKPQNSFSSTHVTGV